MRFISFPTYTLYVYKITLSDLKPVFGARSCRYAWYSSEAPFQFLNQKPASSA